MSDDTSASSEHMDGCSTTEPESELSWLEFIEDMMALGIGLTGVLLIVFGGVAASLLSLQVVVAGDTGVAVPLYLPMFLMVVGIVAILASISVMYRD